ncbi:SusC/RagA family TonB-linked outer membrane protein [Flavobacterium capsici]|uniref:SusC/RagA family TonB-linked outer membrane protein n=1 Tax=Flavobacterium capsici TaxID=3075618 RepID=A0AA96JAH9_9FLAO|nr:MULTISPECIES: SusC/RagA family TonB-linked outer membrane protein [unclassified Flavobacterium]WNM20134.1 SusC/RagA family TonB-linked outer membrane protein [Flavobacterium sp. PMR2A8]WNM21524.1 SusC/RagA family TonB-linked outer membrane protein [Flavobacterium sp. PMTSA4]
MKTKLNGFLTLFLALLVQISFAQERIVSGVVTDNSGLPIPGVNVLVKGTSLGTQTDFDGKYSIKASSSQTLIFTFVGMKTQEVVASTSTVNVKLADNAVELEGVVVTALGVKKSEKAVTYAAQSIKGEAMTEAREQNLVNALSGKIAGVQVTNSSGAVGSSSRIVLRGASTITGNNEALFVIDGVPFDNTNYGNAGSGGGRDLPNGAASINPDDIESISVLKGPTAAALYGIRASKGVVLITTKSGNKKDKFEVSFNTNTTFSNPLRLPNYQNSYGQGATSDYFEFVDGSGGGYNDGVDESWGPALDRGLEFVQWDSFKYGGAPTPWVSHPDNVKDFYNTGVTQTNSISIVNGNENASMRLSVGNSDEKGMIPFTEFKKFNVGFNGSMKLGKKLTAGANVTYFNNKSDNLPVVGYSAGNVVQQFIWSARNVQFTDLKDWRNLPLAPVGTAAEGTPLNWNTVFQNNPYWVLETNINTFDQDRITGSAFLNFKFTDNLSVNGKLMMDHYTQRETSRNAIGTNEFADGYYGEVNRRYTEINAETILTYTKNLTTDLSLTLNAGMNSLKRIRTNQIGELTGGLELPNLYTLANVKSGTTPNIDSNYYEERLNSVLGFGQLSYKNFAFLDFSGRNDWTSLLSTKNNSFFYPAISGSLVLSDMLGFNQSNVNYLKLRAGWSKVGGTGPLGPYSLNRTFDLSNNNFGTVSNLPNTQWNPDLVPETTTGYEFGVDLNAFKNRLRFSATYYSQKNTDLILPIQVEASSFFTSSWENAGEMTNKGIELQLGATVLKKGDFSFDVDLNFAKNKNEVVSLSGADSYTLGGQWGMELQARPGEAYGSIVGFPYTRNDQGQIVYENGLPKVNNSELVVLGNITPDWTGGANFTFKYKNFDLSTLIDAKIGGDIFSMSYMWGRYAGTLEESLIGRETGLVGNGVLADGSPNNVVIDAKTFNQYTYNYSNFTESGIFDASYVKLRQIVFGYSLPKKWLNGTFIQDFKVSVVGRNLALLYKKVPHIDPETGFSNQNGEQGQEFGQLPSARTYGFNINIKF